MTGTERAKAKWKKIKDKADYKKRVAAFEKKVKEETAKRKNYERTKTTHRKGGSVNPNKFEQ